MAEMEPARPDELYPPEGVPMPDATIRLPSAPGAAARPPAAGATFSPVAPELGGIPSGLPEGLAGLERRQMADRGRLESGFINRTEEDRGRMLQAYRATGIGPDELQPFDQEKMREQYSHTPVQAFGSLGSVFALVASSFTRQPMTNGLNAAAAAMNALKKNDDAEYNKAFEAWKSNTDLAVKRHNIQQQAYTNALSLADTDMRSAEAKFRMQAARFGDEKALYMLENFGVSKELFDVIGARDRMITEAAKSAEMINKERFRSAVMSNDPDINSGDPLRMERAFDRYYGKELTPEQQAVRQLYYDRAAEGKKVEPEDLASLHQKFQRPAAGSTSTSTSAEAMRRAQIYETDPKSDTYGDHAKSYDKAMREIRQASAPGVTGNRQVQMASHINQYDESLKKIDAVEKVLTTYVGAAGLAGKANRLRERIGNIFGSNDAARTQFMRDVTYLQLNGPRLLLDQAHGRPLAAEEKKISDIMAGLNAGDLTENTLKSMRDIRALYQRLRAHNKDILDKAKGTAAARETETPPPAAGGGKVDWWSAAPVAGE